MCKVSKAFHSFRFQMISNRSSLVSEWLLFNNTIFYVHLIRYTYGQPVPGSVNVEVCRPLKRYFHGVNLITLDHPEGIPEITAPCHKETKQVLLP